LLLVVGHCKQVNFGFGGLIGHMKEDHIAFIGVKTIWGAETPFGIAQPDRRNHLYCLGKTGVGKTTALRNLIAQDIDAGLGVGVIDPHGDLAEELLNLIPPWRTEDVVYFNPADQEYPIGLNVLHAFPKEHSHLTASGIVGALKGIWSDSWGPRLEYILFATVAALVECENTTLLGVGRMLTDKRYRAWVVKQVNDPMVKNFWTREFESYDSKFLTESVSPILNKVGQLFMTSPIRNVLGQVRSKIDARFMMDNNRIFIANLSKGRLGEDKSHLLGALLVSQFQLAAMGRANVPEHERKDFNLVIDEWQNFTSDSFAGILSEARKYRLCLTLSHQFISQLPDKLRDAVLGNVGSIIAFRLGSLDANILEREFASAYTTSQFIELGNHEVFVKLLEHGRYQEPFRGKTWPPLELHYGRRETIIKRSREKYGTQRIEVEGKIRRWLGAN
jgi:hypothetical protein